MYDVLSSIKQNILIIYTTSIKHNFIFYALLYLNA